MQYIFGDFLLDADARELRRGVDRLRLSPKAMELLFLLISEKRRVLSKQELYDRLWPSTFVVDGNLPVLIREIRRAIGDQAREVIRTSHGIGYSCGVVVRQVDAGIDDAGDRLQNVVHALRHDEREYRLQQGVNLVGREAVAEVFVSSVSVSRRHAIITVDGERATIADLASKNGTFLGKQQILGEALLTDGQLIRFGAVEMLYRRGSTAGPTETLGDF